MSEQSWFVMGWLAEAWRKVIALGPVAAVWSLHAVAGAAGAVAGAGKGARSG